MKRREKLRENYEEALFALLMDEKMEAEGKCLLLENEQINGDPDEAVPDEVSRRCYKTIHRAFAKENFRLISKTAGQAIQRLSVAVFLIVTLVSTAFAISPKFRVDSLNLLIEVSDIATSLKLAKEDASEELIISGKDGVNLLGYQFPALSEKFELTHQDVSSRYVKTKFSSDTGEEITFSVRKVTEAANYNVDTENAQNVENTTINGYEGILVEKLYVFEDKTIDNVSIVWGDTERSVFINVMCGNLGKETAIKLAEQVVYVGGGTTLAEEEKDETPTSNETDEAGIDLMGYCFPALPDGFELLHESISDTSATVIYANEEGKEVWFSVDTAKGNTLNIDTEDADYVETISVGGFQGILVEKTYKFPDGEREQVAVVWGDTDHNSFVDVTTIGLGRSEALALAEQVAYVGGSTTVVKEESSELIVPNEVGVNLLGYQLPKLSDSYTLQYENITDTYGMLVYQDPEGTEVRFSISFAEGKTLSVDTENAKNVETVVINGYEGILVEKPRMIQGELKERILITLGDTDQNYFVNITTTGLGKETAIKLVEQMVYVGKDSLE